MRRQHVHVAVGKPQLQERRRRDDKERHSRDEHHDRALHDPVGETGPKTPAAGCAPEPRYPQAVHAWADDRQHRGEECERVEDGDSDDDRAGRAHRRHEGALEEQHRRQADGDRQTGERDRAARGRHRGREGALATLAAGELVAEPVDDEQRIVDRDAESDQRDDVERVLRYVGEAVQEERAADAADDRQDAHAQGQAGSDDRREDQDEKDEGDGKRDVLGALKV